jgi:hypothetical protein
MFCKTLFTASRSITVIVKRMAEGRGKFKQRFHKGESAKDRPDFANIFKIVMDFVCPLRVC